MKHRSSASHRFFEGFGLGQAAGQVWLRRAKGLILPTFMGRSLGELVHSNYEVSTPLF